jgi:hypothetical protein
MGGSSRATTLVGLAVSFAMFAGMIVALAGRLDAAGLAAALAVGALVATAFSARHPLRSMRALPRATTAAACAGGLLCFFAPPAVLAAVRMSDAPAGSVVVFWTAGGWAALGALSVAGPALWRRHRSRAALAIAGAAAVLAGVAGVVADWERPSSFSPLVRFPLQELAILGAGALFVAGGLLLVRAGRDGRLSGVLLCAAATAVVAAVAWLATAGPSQGLRSIMELPVQVVIAATAWGAVCVAWPTALKRAGMAPASGMLAAAPVLLSGLVWVEQAVGVAGPQPLVAGGVTAGALVLASGVLALIDAGRDDGPATPPRGVAPWLAVVPVLLALAALALPAIRADVTVAGAVGSFSGAWMMTGVESIAGLSALALALVLVAAAAARRSRWLPLLGMAACAAWPWLLAVPTHVLNTWLAPGIQSYYGTEYGSIVFTSVPNALMLLAVGCTGAGFVVVLLARSGILRRSAAVDHPTSEAPRP